MVFPIILYIVLFVKNSPSLLCFLANKAGEVWGRGEWLFIGYF